MGAQKTLIEQLTKVFANEFFSVLFMERGAEPLKGPVLRKIHHAFFYWNPKREGFKPRVSPPLTPHIADYLCNYVDDSPPPPHSRTKRFCGQSPSGACLWERSSSWAGPSPCPSPPSPLSTSFCGVSALESCLAQPLKRPAHVEIHTTYLLFLPEGYQRSCLVKCLSFMCKLPSDSVPKVAFSPVKSLF